MSRRGENIRKRADGRWEARFSVPDPVTGRKKIRSVYARTYADVKAKLTEAKYDFEKGIGEDDRKRSKANPICPSDPDTKEKIWLTELASAWLAETAGAKNTAPTLSTEEFMKSILQENWREYRWRICPEKRRKPYIITSVLRMENGRTVWSKVFTAYGINCCIIAICTAIRISGRQNGLRPARL